MSGWLTRGLVAVAAGAILAFAVTVRVAEFDLQNAGAIILFAGLGYLLVHLALLGWERGWGAGPPAPPRRDEPRRPARPQARRVDPYQWSEGETPGHRPRPRPAVVDYRRAARPDDADDTRILPVVRDEDDDTTALDLRRPDTRGYER